MAMTRIGCLNFCDSYAHEPSLTGFVFSGSTGVRDGGDVSRDGVDVSVTMTYSDSSASPASSTAGDNGQGGAIVLLCVFVFVMVLV